MSENGVKSQRFYSPMGPLPRHSPVGVWHPRNPRTRATIGPSEPAILLSTAFVPADRPGLLPSSGLARGMFGLDHEMHSSFTPLGLVKSSGVAGDLFSFYPSQKVFRIVNFPTSLSFFNPYREGIKSSLATRHLFIFPDSPSPPPFWRVPKWNVQMAFFSLVKIPPHAMENEKE